MLNVTERHVEGVAVLDLEGSLTLGGGSALLRETLRRLLNEGAERILINFAGVKYIDSGGVGELVAALTALERASGSLKFASLPPKVEQVLALSNTLSLFEVYPTPSEALRDYE